MTRDKSEDQSKSKDQHRDKTQELIREQIKSIYGDESGDHKLNQRPDPHTDREAYEVWYAAQTGEVQQTEWDDYYERKQELEQAQKPVADHVVSEDFAHDHVAPDAEAALTIPGLKNANFTEVKSQEPTKLEDKEIARQEQHAKHNKQKVNRKKRKSPWRSFFAAALVSLVFLTAFYNEIIVGQARHYLSPASTISSPVILDPNTSIEVGDEPRIIIPKINVDVPVVYDIKGYTETDIQTGLERGVVHYGETAVPGQIGNNVIVGHSSNNFFNSGKYKFAFVLLDRLEVGDTFILHFEGTRYVYRVFNKQIIQPEDFSLIQPTDKPVTTLITCTPPGTSWRRQVIQAEQISPSATQAVEATTDIPETIEGEVPGNAPSLWDRIF